MLGVVNAIPALLKVAAAWQTRLRPVESRTLLGVMLGMALIASQVARWGTPATRAVAVGLLIVCVGVGVGRWAWHRRQARRQTSVALAILGNLNSVLAAQLRRAGELLQTASGQAERVSVELAELHLQRVVEQIPLPAVESLASARAARLKLWANFTILLSIVGILCAPLRVFEGFDVLVARRGSAPWPMHLVDFAPATVLPPAYLRGSTDSIEFDSSSSQPQGSIVVVRGIPVRQGLQLVATDGIHEVPLISDGQGAMTARYVLESSTRLRVAARFGRVLITQRAELLLEAIPDQPPNVELAGAPKRIATGDHMPVELRYSITDDHGIRQIDLVLRAGSREERRPLVRLDGQTRQHAGALVLGADDGFVNGSYGPVEVWVAARDDNSLAGARWGQSEVITLDKPALGQAQVKRHDAYLELRNQLVAWLASVQTNLGTASEREALRLGTLATLKAIESGAINEPGIRKLMGSFLRAQRDKLSRASSEPRRLATLLEEVTLNVDSALEAIAQRDAVQVSRLLADVSSEIETAAKATLVGELRDSGIVRIRAAQAMLGAGAIELKRLSRLGADLGEIAQAGWLRIGHAFEASDLSNVQRAAAFLAERLRRPSPSFVGGGRPSVEGGRRGSGRSSGAKASDADAHLERVAAELQQLAREHASAIEALDRLVGDSERAVGNDELRGAAKQRADEVRRIIGVLPPLGAEPGSPRAALALGKELARGAAESMEQLQLVAAYEGLRKADAALTEAALLQNALGADATDLEPRATAQLRQQLAEHRDWIKAKLDEAREHNLSRSKEPMRKASERELEMAERAMRLARREAQKDAVLPEDVRRDLEQSSRLMRQAAESLDSGRGTAAMERQRDAQNLLERNLLGSDQEPSESEDKMTKPFRDATGRRNSGGGNVASTSDVESREAFRRRVQQGLSREVSPALSPAVRRYAEGLLK